jgi:hypothetical protein
MYADHQDILHLHLSMAGGAMSRPTKARAKR